MSNEINPSNPTSTAQLESYMLSRYSKSISNVQIALYGFLSVILIVVVYYVEAFALRLGILNYTYGNDLAYLGMLVIGILFYFFAIFGPAIYVATIAGWRGFTRVIVFEMFWIFILLVLFIVLFNTSTLSILPASLQTL